MPFELKPFERLHPVNDIDQILYGHGPEQQKPDH